MKPKTEKDEEKIFIFNYLIHNDIHFMEEKIEGTGIKYDANAMDIVIMEIMVNGQSLFV